MGMGKGLDLSWMKKMAGGGIEANDQTVCCNALRIGAGREQLSGESI